MNISRKDRKELDALSKEVFGVSSKWQQYFKGVEELVTKTVKEVVPGDKGEPDTTKETVVPVLTENGSKQYKTRVYSVDEIKELLLKFKAQVDDIRIKMKEVEELKKIQEKVQNEASGQTSL